MVASIVSVHDELHRRLEERVWRLLEAMATRDTPQALRHFHLFATVLDAHMAIENERVIPAWRPLVPAEGPGRVDHLEGDHVILVREVTEIRGFLPEPGDLRTTLHRLPVVYRLLSVLEHHTAREVPVYRALETALSTAARADLAALLSGLVDRLEDR